MRTAIAAILSFSKDGRYEVAIQQRLTFMERDEWEVHIFVREEKLSGLLNCALLAHSIEQLSIDLLSCESKYNISTKEEPNDRPSFKIW